MQDKRNRGLTRGSRLMIWLRAHPAVIQVYSITSGSFNSSKLEFGVDFKEGVELRSSRRPWNVILQHGGRVSR